MLVLIVTVAVAAIWGARGKWVLEGGVIGTDVFVIFAAIQDARSLRAGGEPVRSWLAVWCVIGAWLYLIVRWAKRVHRTKSDWVLVLVAVGTWLTVLLTVRPIISFVTGIPNIAISGTCPAGETVPAPSAISPAGNALLARMLPVPAGAEQDTTLKQGVVSLSNFMNEVYADDPAEQARLTGRCFQTVAQRGWVAPNGIVTDVWLIQFGTNADARSYTLATEQGGIADFPSHFTVAGVADAMGFTDPTLDQYGNAVTQALGDAGSTSIIVDMYSPASPDSAAASRVLQAQNARLSTGS